MSDPRVDEIALVVERIEALWPEATWAFSTIPTSSPFTREAGVTIAHPPIVPGGYPIYAFAKGHDFVAAASMALERLRAMVNGKRRP